MAGKITDDRVERAMEAFTGSPERKPGRCRYLGDELIINTWAGLADSDAGRPVDESTLFQVFSVTKGVHGYRTAHTGRTRPRRLRPSDHALLARVRWREARHRITLRDALCHRSGIPQMPTGVTPESMFDWDWMIHLDRVLPAVVPGRLHERLSRAGMGMA